MEEDQRAPVDTVLPGMGLHPLPAGWTPIEAFVMVKCLDEEGTATWVFRTTHPPNRQELLGALVEQSDLLRKRLVREWEEDLD